MWRKILLFVCLTGCSGIIGINDVTYRDGGDQAPPDSSGGRCGDGVVQPPELCDDGNRVNGDACDNNCKPPGPGNGEIDPGEQCDDGNRTDGDACENDGTPARC